MTLLCECGICVLHSHLFYFILEVLTISKQELQINEEIRDKEILVIDADGTKLRQLRLYVELWIMESTALSRQNVKRKQGKIKRLCQ